MEVPRLLHRGAFEGFIAAVDHGWAAALPNPNYRRPDGLNSPGAAQQSQRGRNSRRQGSAWRRYAQFKRSDMLAASRAESRGPPAANPGR